MGVQFGQPLCYEGEYSGRAFVGSSQSNAQEVKRRVFFKNIFMALDSSIWWVLGWVNWVLLPLFTQGYKQVPVKSRRKLIHVEEYVCFGPEFLSNAEIIIPITLSIELPITLGFIRWGLWFFQSTFYLLNISVNGSNRRIPLFWLRYNKIYLIIRLCNVPMFLHH